MTKMFSLLAPRRLWVTTWFSPCLSSPPGFGFSEPQELLHLAGEALLVKMLKITRLAMLKRICLKRSEIETTRMFLEVVKFLLEGMF